MNPRVLVVLLNYRTPQMTLRAAMAALADLPDGGEMVIVDNASDDGSAEYLVQAIADMDQGSRVRFIQSPVNGGFGAGNNLGLQAMMSDGQVPEYFYILNSDAFPDQGCIPALLAHLKQHPRAGFAASHVRGEDDVAHGTAFRFPTILGEFEGAARLGIFSRLLRRWAVPMALPDRAVQVDWAAGASILMRAQTLAEIGHFDETFFLYFEETDLIQRGARAGWTCWYVPQAKVMHIGSVSTGMKEWRRMPAYWFASRRHYFVKNHGRAYAAGAWGARVAGAAIHRLRCVVKGAPSQEPAHFLGDLVRFGLTPQAPTGRPVSHSVGETS